MTKVDKGSKEFSKILIDKMKENKITQAELSRMIDVSDTTIYRYIKGETKPHPLLMQRLADVFKCQIKDLYKNYEV